MESYVHVQPPLTPLCSPSSHGSSHRSHRASPSCRGAHARGLGSPLGSRGARGGLQVANSGKGLLLTIASLAVHLHPTDGDSRLQAVSQSDPLVSIGARAELTLDLAPVYSKCRATAPEYHFPLIRVIRQHVFSQHLDAFLRCRMGGQPLLHA